MAKMAKDRSKHMVSVVGPRARNLTIYAYLKPKTLKDTTDQSFSVVTTSFKFSGTALAPLEEECQMVTKLRSLSLRKSPTRTPTKSKSGAN